MNEKIHKSTDLDNLNILNTPIKHLTLDSRQVCPGDIFVALVGSSFNGIDFIPEAIRKGAAAVLLEGQSNEQSDYPSTLDSAPIIPYSNLRDALGYIADRFYNEPSKHLKLTGITGTNGKTSSAYFIAQLMSALGTQCGVMGTLGNGFLGELVDRQCTTPDAILTHKELARLLALGAECVAMEVTSHALEQKRVNGVRFFITLFTNLTRDHLDYHGSMEAYFFAKKLLFTQFDSKYRIINIDDPSGRLLWQECFSAGLNSGLMAYTINQDFDDSRDNPYDSRDHSIALSLPGLSKDNTICAVNTTLNEHGIHAKLITPFGEGELQSPLLGQFNLSNLLGAITVLCLHGFSLAQVLSAVPLLKTAPGRMVRLGGGTLPLIIVDYAHSPDSLKQVLQSLRPHCSARLWCVFGCGGDRDRGKRPMMAQVAESLSDEIVVTEDNSRTEDPNIILQEIMQGFQNPKKIHKIMDRAKAIHFAVQSANPLDIVLVAGKGHETYQIVGREKYPFDDQEIIAKALAGRNDVLIKG